jgi:hypothetical protein
MCSFVFCLFSFVFFTISYCIFQFQWVKHVTSDYGTQIVHIVVDWLLRTWKDIICNFAIWLFVLVQTWIVTHWNWNIQYEIVKKTKLNKQKTKEQMKCSYMYVYTGMIFAAVLSLTIKIFHRHLGSNLYIFAVKASPWFHRHFTEILWHITAISPRKNTDQGDFVLKTSVRTVYSSILLSHGIGKLTW